MSAVLVKLNCENEENMLFTFYYATFNILPIIIFAQVEDEVDKINTNVFTELERKLQE